MRRSPRTGSRVTMATTTCSRRVDVHPDQLVRLCLRGLINAAAEDAEVRPEVEFVVLALRAQRACRAVLCFAGLAVVTCGKSAPGARGHEGQVLGSLHRPDVDGVACSEAAVSVMS